MWRAFIADCFGSDQKLNCRIQHWNELRAISVSRHSDVKQTNKRKLEHKKTKQINRMKSSASTWCIRWDNHAAMLSVSSDQASSGHRAPLTTKMPWLLCCGCTVINVQRRGAKTSGFHRVKSSHKKWHGSSVISCVFCYRLWQAPNLFSQNAADFHYRGLFFFGSSWHNNRV